MMHRLILCLSIMVLSTAVSTYAYAQRNSDTDNRIRRLENEIQTLGRAVFKGDNGRNAPSFQVQGANNAQVSQQQTMIANMGVKLSQLEGEIRNLTGQIEQQNFKIRQLENQILGQSATLQSIQTMSSGQAMPSTAMGQGRNGVTNQAGIMQRDRDGFVGVTSNGGSSVGMPVANLPMGNVTSQNLSSPPSQNLGSFVQKPNGEVSVNTQNPTYLYDTAFSMLQQGDYAGSEKALTQFISNYPQHPLTANAQYWLGETFYVRNDFQNAAKSFANGYQKHPKSSKAPDSLLKLALSLSNINKNQEACVTLSQLKSEYPKASSTIMRKADEELKRLSCSN